MGWAAKLAFYVIMLSIAISIFNILNLCWESGSVLPDGSYNEVCFISRKPVSSNYYYGMNRSFIPMTVETFYDYKIVDASGRVVNASDFQSWNASMQDAASYKTAPAGITDIFGFFSWVITGIKVIVNTLLMPMYGLPEYISDNFWMPFFITKFFGTVLFLIQLLGLYEFATGREVFR